MASIHDIARRLRLDRLLRGSPLLGGNWPLLSSCRGSGQRAYDCKRRVCHVCCCGFLFQCCSLIWQPSADIPQPSAQQRLSSCFPRPPFALALEKKKTFVVVDVVYSVIVCLCSFVIVVFPCMSMFLRVALNVLLASVLEVIQNTGK